MIKQLLENKIGQASITGNCHIATIQAIIILVFWQEPKDRSTWIKSGLATRMAYQAGLHKTQRVSPSTLTEIETRRLRVSWGSLAEVSASKDVADHILGVEWTANVVL
jgi:hypothetical protein